MGINSAFRQFSDVSTYLLSASASEFYKFCDPPPWSASLRPPRLYQYRRELETKHDASGVPASSTGNSPMRFLELLNAAQILAAAAPAMKLTFKRHHYELLLAVRLIGERVDNERREGRSVATSWEGAYPLPYRGHY